MTNLHFFSKTSTYFKSHNFRPRGIVGVLINPLFFIRKGLFSYIKSYAEYMQGNMLDFGCGSKPYKTLFKVEKHIGVDIGESGHSHENSEVDIFYDGKHLPFNDSDFDSIFSSEVFEHVFNLSEILDEINRVLKPKGYLLITTPFMWHEHEQPYDYGRYTSFGMTHLLEQHNFKVISIDKNGHFLEVICQMVNLYIVERLAVLPRTLGKLITFLFTAPLTLLFLIIIKILPKDESMYHNLIVLAQKRS